MVRSVRAEGHDGHGGLREFLDDVDSIWTDFRVDLQELRDAATP